MNYRLIPVLHFFLNDTMDQTILLAKLEQYGITGNIHSCFRAIYQTENNMLNTIILNQIQKQ